MRHTNIAAHCSKDLSWPNASSSKLPVIEAALHFALTFCTFCTLHSTFTNVTTAQYEIVNVADWPPDEALKKVAARFSEFQIFFFCVSPRHRLASSTCESLKPFDQFDPGRVLQSLRSIEKEWLLLAMKIVGHITPEAMNVPHAYEVSGQN